MGFISKLFGVGDFNTIKRKMSDGGDSRNFPRTKQYVGSVGTNKVAAAFGAVAFTAVGVLGLLDFFFPDQHSKGGENRRDRGRR
jgi:hypothetical protein